MGIFIAQQTVQAMASANIGTVGSKVTVLGLTFKEDCPDLRNSRVPDIISELIKYGCEVQVHDPLCNLEEAQKEYGITLSEETELFPAHALVLAVSHHTYLEWSLEQWKKFLLSGCIFVDVQGKMPEAQLQSADYKVWRL